MCFAFENVKHKNDNRTNDGMQANAKISAQKRESIMPVEILNPTPVRNAY